MAVSNSIVPRLGGTVNQLLNDLEGVDEQARCIAISQRLAKLSFMWKGHHVDV